MKKIFIVALGALALSFNAQAQKKSGAIQYETVIDPVAMAEASGRQIPEQMKARMPKSIKAEFELLFNANGASYMPVQDVEDSNSGGFGGGGGGGRMMMRMGGFGGGNEFYYTFADQKLSEVTTLRDTSFIMPSQLTLAKPEAFNNRPGQEQSNEVVQFLPVPPIVEVIKSDETRKIANIECKKVTIKTIRKAKLLGMEKDITDETVLWYTNELGFNFSPDPNLWTEGAVLAIQKKGGDVTAKSIQYRKVNDRDVLAPKKAVSISREEFQAKQESMRRTMRPGQIGQGRATFN
jgi:uncharacterized ubiquitin-like protein YukD